MILISQYLKQAKVGHDADTEADVEEHDDNMCALPDTPLLDNNFLP